MANPTGTELIAAERERQVSEEGYDVGHDDRYVDGQLALAALAYAAPCRLFTHKVHADGHTFVDPWPWRQAFDRRLGFGERGENPGNQPPDPATYTKAERLDLLVKAGALIAAEIDRVQRLEDDA